MARFAVSWPIHSGDLATDETMGASTKTSIRWSSDKPEEEKFKVGYYYTWEAAMGDHLQLAMGRSPDRASVQGLCPDGWRVPSQQDWRDLVLTLDSLAGPFTNDNDRRWEGMAEVMKSTRGWVALPGTDQFGLNFLPVGFMDEPGAIINLGRETLHWASSQDSTGSAYAWNMSSNNQRASLFASSPDRLRSVRCVFDG